MPLPTNSPAYDQYIFLSAWLLRLERGTPASDLAVEIKRMRDECLADMTAEERERVQSS